MPITSPGLPSFDEDASSYRHLSSAIPSRKDQITPGASKTIQRPRRCEDPTIHSSMPNLSIFHAHVGLMRNGSDTQPEKIRSELSWRSRHITSESHLNSHRDINRYPDVRIELIPERFRDRPR